jgi:predicted alpha/beta-fold hydrolase
LQAEDDPIAPKDAIPFDAIKQNPNCTLVLTPTGGHLGWCSSTSEQGILGAPWTDKAVIEYFAAVRKLQIEPDIEKEAVVEARGVYTMGTSTHQAP